MMRRLNWTTIALIGGLVVLVLLVAYFASNRNAEQDKLTGNRISAAPPPEQAPPPPANPAKACASRATADLIKRELFGRAAELRGSDQQAYGQLAAYSSLRIDNPVLESQDSATGAVNCSASIALDLPPGVTAVGGRHSLSSDTDYTIQPAAEGAAVQLRNADTIIAPLATLARVAPPTQPPPSTSPASNEAAPEANAAAAESAKAQAGPKTQYPGRPSFDCAKARTRSEKSICGDSGLAALDVNMVTQYRRALAVANPAQRALLERTRSRFLAYRERCPNRQCIGDAYVGRMREIRDIMEGRWVPPR